MKKNNNIKIENNEINVVNFNGLPILIKKNAFNPSKEELNHIKKLNYINSLHSGTSLKLSKEKYILKNKKLKNIENIFNKYIDIYKKDILQINNKTVLLNSWTTWQTTNSTHPPHVHPNVLISLVYYIQCEKGSITFTQDRSILCNGYAFEYQIVNYNEYNSASWNLSVKTGDLIIFPGWLRHQAKNLSSNSDRYVVAANYFLKGALGNDLDATYLEI
jgi:uncharacterized protein (TIGR02466 family)